MATASAGAASTPVLQVEDLGKEYADAVALKSASFEVNDGEIVAILGPSGSGKTTILRLIAGLDSPTRGRIRLKGRDITALPPQERRIGVMFQSYALFSHMTVLENIMFGLKANKVNAAEREARFKKYMALVRLPPQIYAARFPSELSGGQQQRVALARALAVEPNVLLLDEPFSSLDAQVREEMRVELLSRLREAGITAVLVTHDQVDAAYMADRVVLMNEGSVAQIGSYANLYLNPRNRFVGQFIGESNWLASSGRAPGSQPAGLHAQVTVGGRIWNVQLAEPLDTGGIGEGVVQVRRDAVLDLSVGHPQPGQTSPRGNLITGVVKNVIPAGSQCILWMDVEGQGSLQPYYVANSAALPILNGQHALLEATTVTLVVDPELCRYFRHAASEKERV